MIVLRNRAKYGLSPHVEEGITDAHIGELGFKTSSYFWFHRASSEHCLPPELITYSHKLGEVPSWRMNLNAKTGK